MGFVEIWNDYKHIIWVLVLTILLAYLVGINIVSVVDKRMSDISIRMPNIKIPLNVQVDKNGKGKIKGSFDYKISTLNNNTSNTNCPSESNTIEQFENSDGNNNDINGSMVVDESTEPPSTNSNNNSSTEQHSLAPTEEMDEPPQYQPIPVTQQQPEPPSQPMPAEEAMDMVVGMGNGYGAKYDTPAQMSQARMEGRAGYSASMDTGEEYLERERPAKTKTATRSGKYRVGCQTDDDCNQVWGNGENICKSNNKCHCVTGSGAFCHKGPTLFKNPKAMKPEERSKFREKWRGGTVQDYMNWLRLWRGELHLLEEPHARNYRKLMSRGRLETTDMPKRTMNPPPYSKSDYFRQVYKDGKFLLERAPYIEKGTRNHSLGPYRGYNYGDYNGFIPPEGVEFDVVTDIPEKRDPFELNYFLRPRVTTGGERTTAGRILQKAGQRYTKPGPELYQKLDNPRTDLAGARRELVFSDDFGPGDVNFL